MLTTAGGPPCMFCGKTYAEHADEKDPRFTARVPCLAIKAGFRSLTPEQAESRVHRESTRNGCGVPGCFVCSGAMRRSAA